MNNQINLAEETNVEKLKSLAYDQLILQDQAAQNLRILNQRIAELSEPKKTDK